MEKNKTYLDTDKIHLPYYGLAPVANSTDWARPGTIYISTEPPSQENMKRKDKIDNAKETKKIEMIPEVGVEPTYWRRPKPKHWNTHHSLRLLIIVSDVKFHYGGVNLRALRWTTRGER
jgi:hypothetical protein